MSHWQDKCRDEAPDEQVTLGQDLSEESLGADCAECRDLHTSYVEGCLFLEEIESNSEGESEVREVRARVSASRRAWLSAAGRAVRTPAYTRSGVRAKAPVVKGLLQEVCGDNMEAMSAALTFVDDVERILSDNP